MRGTRQGFGSPAASHVLPELRGIPFAAPARSSRIADALVLMAAPDAVKRQAGAWGTPPATLEVMRRLKDAFDPEHVLNPGRSVI